MVRFKRMRNLALIPARSGSKGLSDKNIRMLKGKHLLAYSIEAAKTAGIFNEIMVSTDSDYYAQIARKYGADVPFFRTKETSSDDASTWDVVAEVLKEYDKIGKYFDTMCLLQPTSPLRRKDDITEAYEVFLRNDATAVVSVCKCEHSPLWCGTLDDDMSLEDFISIKGIGNRQHLQEYYRINGAIYIWNITEFNRDRNMYRKGCFAYVMPQERSIDIDTEFDFRVADALMGAVLDNQTS